MDNDSKAYLAEMIGTFALVLIGCGSAVIAGGQIGFTGISFAFGLTVLMMVYAIGPISSCHINPAITIAMLVAGKIDGRRTIGYIAAQVAGAALAAGVLYWIATGKAGYDIATMGLGQNGFDLQSPGKYSMLSAIVAEVVLTFLFLITIFGATHEKAPAGFAGLAIGMSLVVIHLIGIPITGTSVNPARSIGPALFVGGKALSQVWLFVVAPIVGGVLAAWVWKAVALKEEASK